MTTLNYETPKTYEDLLPLFSTTLSGNEYKRARMGFALYHVDEAKYVFIDERPLKALEVCQRYVDGEATDSELNDAVYASAAYASATIAHAAVAHTVDYRITAGAAYAVTYAGVAIDEVTLWTDPLPQKTLEQLEKWFPRSEL